MKKRLFIAIHYLEIGGAEISLIGLMQALDYGKYDVDLFVYSHQGDLMHYIPKQVHILPENPTYAHIEKPMKEALRKGYYGIVWGRLLARIQYLFYKWRKKPIDNAAIYQYIFNAVEPYLPNINPDVEYDLAISFLAPHNIVLNKVRAKKKICWIHTDYTHIDVNAELEFPIWSRFNHIISISADVTRNFLKVFPTLRHKIIEIENILSSKFVRQRADEISLEEIRKEMPEAEGVVNILSVGRFSYPKNYDNVPSICKRINHEASQNSKLAFRWYIIGYGGEEALIRKKIKEEGMQDSVILLGKKNNPYPYIKACDFYVQPSRYEGKSVTVREAQMLYKPVIITDYPTAKSQIQNGIDGVIVPMENELCAKGIYKTILNTPLIQHITTFLHTHDYGNIEEIKKLDKVAE